MCVLKRLMIQKQGKNAPGPVTQKIHTIEGQLRVYLQSKPKYNDIVTDSEKITN